MHLTGLCFVLPSDDTDNHHHRHHKHNPKPIRHHHRSCGIRVHDLLSNALHRLYHLKDNVIMCYHPDHAPRKQGSGVFQDTDGVQVSSDQKLGGENPRTFSYSELYIGTRGFSKDEILGSGGFGRVFRAVLPSDGTVVAVKCLAERGEKFEKTFTAELVAVAQLRHRNLVRLRGWCCHDDQLYLVYDYMPNRSLDQVLFRRPEKGGAAASPPLSWERRVKIVKGLAAALFYLHEQLEAQIIHRDVKTSNVMLDSNYNAKLGDFGLARWLEHELDYQIRIPSMKNYQQFRLTDTTRIGGTIGYLPPESFQKRSVATAKSDVFSFGIVVLEIVAGRRAVDLAFPDDQIILLDWIRGLADEKMALQAGDARLKDGSYKLSDMANLIHLGLLCTLNEPKSRPSMRWVVEALSGSICNSVPPLPSFKSQPRYISISHSSTSTSNTSSNAATSPAMTATNAATSPAMTATNAATSPAMTATNTTTSSIASTTFLTAKADTMYVTAEYGKGNENGNANSSRRLLHSNSFPVFETPRAITYDEVIAATDNFSHANRVAEVDFGTAYSGILDDRLILVKRLGMKTCPALRARFTDELSNLGRLRHRNLKHLRGWCTERGEMLVVYDNFATNRLLGHILSRKTTVLRWNHRYNIVKGLACGIRYLHEEWDEQVIHRNITSSAISVDFEMNPRLGSFALAEFLTRNEHSHHVVHNKKSSVRGIFGYMSPEYMETGEATTMADVYSFGVVLLEVITGELAVDFRRPDVLLVKRVRDVLSRKGKYEELLDPRLDGEYDHNEMVRLVKLGMACTNSNPELRPSMREIVSILDGYDKCFLEDGQKKEKSEGWKERNTVALSLIKRIQALGIQ